MRLRTSRLVPLALILSLVALPRRSSAATTTDPDKTLSPYFVVDGAEPGVEALPLESTHAKVHIAGVIADVTVTQAYKNDGKKPINARYVFPASTRAAVYGMKMMVGTRVIVAKIKEREAARAEYEAAKQAGKTASLLEQDRPNVFSMNVANILPGDHILVELRYTELLVPTDGTYELDYPTVVGPRYVSAKVDPSDSHNQFAASGYQHQGQAPSYEFGIDVALDAGMKIQGIDSPSHAIQTTYAAGHTSATIGLGAGDTTGGNRDFVLRYRLGGDDLASGLLLYPGKDESFFLMMVQPPKRPTPEQIPPREYVFIVDVSGSMEGFPLDTAKHLMRDLIGRLRPTDTFDLLLFAGDSRLYREQSVTASKHNVDDAIAFMSAQNGGGGTELLPALQRAMALPRPAAGVSRTFVVITDGYIAEEPAIFDQVRGHLGEANVFAFGIGSGVNRHLIEGVAKAGQGEAFVVLNGAEAPAAAIKFRDYVESPVLTSVKVAFDGFGAYDVEPKSLPDVFAQRPVVVFGKYKGALTGKIKLTGVSGHGRFVNTFDVATFDADPANQALSYLWARTRIANLSDFYQGDANKDEVVKLGLEYNLLTKFTSFIAVQQIVRTAGNATDVDQQLPMPQGVSDDAVGNEVGAEPPLAILLVFVGLGLGWQVRRRRIRARRLPEAA
jgi:Ca-activated chloride channel homolog